VGRYLVENGQPAERQGQAANLAKLKELLSQAFPGPLGAALIPVEGHQGWSWIARAELDETRVRFDEVVAQATTLLPKTKNQPGVQIVSDRGVNRLMMPNTPPMYYRIADGTITMAGVMNLLDRTFNRANTLNATAGANRFLATVGPKDEAVVFVNGAALFERVGLLRKGTWADALRVTSADQFRSLSVKLCPGAALFEIAFHQVKDGLPRLLAQPNTFLSLWEPVRRDYAFSADASVRSLSDVVSVLKGMAGKLDPDIVAEYEQEMAELTQEMGFDFHRDLLAHIGGEVAIGVRPRKGARNPDVLLIGTVGDEKKVQERIETLFAFAEMKWDRSQEAGCTIFRESPGDGRALAIGDRRIVWGTSFSMVSEAVRSFARIRAVKAKRAPSAGVVHVDLATGAALLSRLGSRKRGKGARPDLGRRLAQMLGPDAALNVVWRLAGSRIVGHAEWRARRLTVDRLSWYP